MRAVLGRGGTGIVFDGVRESNGQAVAIKMLSLEASKDWTTWELFKRSSEILRGLSHRSLPRIYAFDEASDGRLVLVRERCDGGTLHERIAEKDARLEAPLVRKLLTEMLELLDYLQRLVPPVVHRDIKPANIMFRTADDWDPVLVDFDTIAAPAAKRTGLTIVGTPGYAAPEQFAGHSTPASDVYGLGATMLFVITHAEPDDLARRDGRFDVEAELSALDPVLSAVLMRMVEPDLTRRYRWAREALADLKRPVASVATAPVAAAPVSVLPAPIQEAPAPDNDDATAHLVQPIGFASRWFICKACGAPCQGPPQGGSCSCGYCKSEQVLPHRPKPTGSPEPESRVPPNDPARFAAFRGQEGDARERLASFVTLFGRSDIPVGREQEALVLWQSLRKRAGQGDPAAAEELLAVTELCVKRAVKNRALDGANAFWESALDASTLPRHRQVCLGHLCRLAVNQRDLDRARYFLSMMTAGGDSLESDSAYRLSGAMIATARGDGQRVIDLLGDRRDVIPMYKGLDPLASALRANAFELRLEKDRALYAFLHEVPMRELAAIRRSNPGISFFVQTAAWVSEQAAANKARAIREAEASKRHTTRLKGFGLAMIVLVTAVMSRFVGCDDPKGFFDPHWEHDGWSAPLGFFFILTGPLAVTLMIRAEVKAHRYKSDWRYGYRLWGAPLLIAIILFGLWLAIIVVAAKAVLPS